jgi:hypothetical protein
MTTNTATKNAGRKKKNTEVVSDQVTETQAPEVQNTAGELNPEELQGLSPEELIKKILEQSAKIKEIESQTSNKKPRGTGEPKVKTADQVRKAELDTLWETLEVVEGDPIRSKERGDQLAALPKLARLLPFNQLPALLEQIAAQVVSEREGFIASNEVDTDKIDLFGEPRTVETLIEMAMTRKPKAQPKRKAEADEEALQAAEDETACPDPSAHEHGEENTEEEA